MTTWNKSFIGDKEDILQTHQFSGSALAGHLLGIITVDLPYPKLPGNVANATTYPFPVLYEKVAFEIEQLFAGDPTIEEMIIQAAKRLEADGVRAIIGACGYFAHFQKSVAEAVNIPVYMSSLLQLPLIKIALKEGQKILVLCADGDSLNADLLEKVGGNIEDCIVRDIGKLESFAPIRWGKTVIDNYQLTEDLKNVAESAVNQHQEIAAILLECSDLPPYACDIQQATGLPVYDFISMIQLVQHTVMQKRYRGFF